MDTVQNILDRAFSILDELSYGGGTGHERHRAQIDKANALVNLANAMREADITYVRNRG